MERTALTPYLFFNGNCREAMDKYTEIFGGELTLQTYGELPNNPNPELADQVMHASLSGGEVSLMASDSMEEGNLGRGRVYLCVSGKDEQKMREMFDRLGEGGNITAPLRLEFWGDIFGTLIDKFDVNWMFVISPKKEGE